MDFIIHSSENLSEFIAMPLAQRRECLQYCTATLRQESMRYLPMEDFNTNPSHVTLQNMGDMGITTVAAIDLPRDTALYIVKGWVVPKPTVYTIQVHPAGHMIISGGAEFLAHGCDPNIRITTSPESVTVWTLRDIKKGEVLAFNYLTTEFCMSEPFECGCGSDTCYRRIAGFQMLSVAQKKELAPLITEAVLELWRR